jgi:two-component system CheB/CheR fusion protein
VVGIGVSAGGLEALVEVLRHLPSETGMAFVVAPPSDPQQKSNLVESLSRLTGMPVTEAADGLRLEPNHVYILPSATDVAGRVEVWRGGVGRA